MSRQTYRHTFKNGRVITFEVELSVNPPIFLTKPADMLNNCPDIKGEYSQWLENVVFPDVAERMGS